MATKIVTKSGSGAPATTDLVAGELAVDLTNKRLYTENGSAAIIELGTNPSGDVTFGDNGKAIFGAGSDLQIYHDGAGSYIDDQGTGPIRIRSGIGGALRFQDLDGDDLINATSNGAVTLYHNNAAKLATTSTGIDVTGGITATGNVTVGDSPTVTGLRGAKSVVLSDPLGGVDFVAYANDNGLTDGQYIGGFLFGNDDNNTTEDHFAGMWANASSTAGSMDLRFAAGKSYYEADTPQMILNTAGNVGIGSASDGAVLQLDKASSSYFDMQSDSALRTRIYNDSSQTILETTTNNLIFKSASSEAMRIDSSGNVGIGNSSPAYPLHVEGAAKVQLTGGATSADFDITSGTTWRFRSNPTTGANSYGLDIVKGSVGTDVKMSIDSSGNLLVGKTATTLSVAGTYISAAGSVGVTRASDDCLTLNRTGTDGAIASFYKDGSTVGSIGVISSDLEIHSSVSGHVGIRFANGGLFPTDNSGTVTNGAADIGNGSFRFKDLYLSGGVYLGGTTAANFLDDYEEGTWIPTFEFGGASVGATYSIQQGSYTKVGNLVTASCFVLLTDKGTSTGDAKIGGLPFASANVTDQNFAASVYNSAITFADFLQAFTGVNASTVSLREVTNAGVQSTITDANFANNSSMMASVSYRV